MYIYASIYTYHMNMYMKRKRKHGKSSMSHVRCQNKIHSPKRKNWGEKLQNLQCRGPVKSFLDFLGVKLILIALMENPTCWIVQSHFKPMDCIFLSFVGAPTATSPKNICK